MPKFAANLSTMFPELDPPARFAAAARVGFRAVEFLQPYAWPAGRVRGWLDDNGLRFLLLNTLRSLADDGPPAAILAGHEAEFRGIMERALDYCTALGGSMIHVTAGRVPDGLAPAECARVFVDNLRAAAPMAADAGVTLMLEPLNTRSQPGYLHSTTAETRRLIEAVGDANVRLQYDFFHMQIMQGNHVETLTGCLDILGHVQFSSVPGRHEPQHGELNFPYLFAALDALGYDGWVGCEYAPKGDTWEGLSWAVPYGFSADRGG